jgi:hypothetical protein
MVPLSRRFADQLECYLGCDDSHTAVECNSEDNTMSPYWQDAVLLVIKYDRFPCTLLLALCP